MTPYCVANKMITDVQSLGVTALSTATCLHCKCLAHQLTGKPVRKGPLGPHAEFWGILIAFYWTIARLTTLTALKFNDLDAHGQHGERQMWIQAWCGQCLHHGQLAAAFSPVVSGHGKSYVQEPWVVQVRRDGQDIGVWVLILILDPSAFVSCIPAPAGAL